MSGNHSPNQSLGISPSASSPAGWPPRMSPRCSVSSWRELLRSAEQSDVNIEAAVVAKPGGSSGRGQRGERIAVDHGVGGCGIAGSLAELARIRTGIAAAQIEGERAAVGAQTGVAQRLLEAARIAVQEIERVGAVGREDGGDAPVLREIEPDGNLAEAGGFEVDLDLVVAGFYAPLYGDRHLLGDGMERGNWGGLRLGGRRA